MTVTCTMLFFMLSVWWKLGCVLVQAGRFLRGDDSRRAAARVFRTGGPEEEKGAHYSK